jgi:hypothetical protein
VKERSMLSSSPSKIHEPLVTGVSPRPTDRRQRQELRNTRGALLTLTQQGDVEDVRAALRQVIDSGHPDATPRALTVLGVLLAEEDVEGARAALQQAIDSGHPHAAPIAMRNLELLAQQGEK